MNATVDVTDLISGIYTNLHTFLVWRRRFIDHKRGLLTMVFTEEDHVTG